MEFKELTLVDVEKVRKWRNQCLYALRTPFLLTEQMQVDFYSSTICNRLAKARFWGIWDDERFIGMCGLENIEWENGCAEISIILDPEKHGLGLGQEAVRMLLEKGFNGMRLQTIYGECYTINPAYKFWEQIGDRYSAFVTYLPNRKYWDGDHYDSMYFSIDQEDFNVTNNS